MPLVNMKEMLKKANEGGYAVGNFDVFNVEMLRGVLQSAEELKAPVILAFAEPFESLVKMEHFAKAAIAMAEKSPVPVALHLDHANNYPIVVRAIACGFTSVMMDASDKSLDGNIAAVRKIVELCAPLDISVEAELGHVGGLEGQYEAGDDDECHYTEVDEAVKYVKETGIDALAVAIGTVHGVYKSKPNLNIQRLKEIKDRLPIPLVLHGGSGLSDEDMRACVKNGINKINIFTDMSLEASKALGELSAAGAPYFDMSCGAVKAVSKVVKDRISVFGSIGKA